MAPSYQIRAILLLTVIISNIQLNTAVFDPMESQEEIELLPNCFRRGYTVKVQQKDSEARSCWDVITVSSCWGLCHSNEVIHLQTMTYILIHFEIIECFHVYIDTRLAFPV